MSEEVQRDLGRLEAIQEMHTKQLEGIDSKMDVVLEYITQQKAERKITVKVATWVATAVSSVVLGIFKLVPLLFDKSH